MRARVLVVDDDRLIRRIGQRTLAQAGLGVTVAASIAEALAGLGDATIDVAIIDYFLGPSQCGCDLIAPLRKHNRAMRIAVVSGLGILPELVQHALAAGADLVASKMTIDWVALARGDPSSPRAPLRPSIDLESLKREAIQGAYLVHNRNVSRTARALGIHRSNLQRALRRMSSPMLEDEE
jgi:ActR/RegA family two-component response regulator